MRKTIYLVFLFAFIVIAGCSKSAPILQLPNNLSPEIKGQIDKGWPKILNACPGFYKYSGDMKFERVDDNTYEGMPEQLKRIDIVFKIGYEKIVPLEYRAAGHTCYYGISKDGKSIRISKEPCLAICKDRAIETYGSDYVEAFH